MPTTQPVLVEVVSGFPWLPTVSFVAALISIVLAGFAMWLSWRFYAQSRQEAVRVTTATTETKAMVRNVETNLVSILGTTQQRTLDLLSPDSAATQEADKKIAEVRETTSEQISALTQRVEETGGDVSKLRAEVTDLVDQAITQTRDAERQVRHVPRPAALQQAIIKVFSSHAASGGLTVRSLASILLTTYRLQVAALDLRNALGSLIDCGVLRAQSEFTS